MSKSKGSLTVEALFLTIVILAVVTILLSINLHLEKHAQIFELSEEAGEKVSNTLYAVNRIKVAATGEFNASSGDYNTFLSDVIGTKITQGVNALNAKGVETLMHHLIKKEAGIKDEHDFNNYYRLAVPLSYDVNIGENAIYIDVKQKYKVIDMLGTFGDVSVSDTHIIPLRSARSIISGKLNTMEGSIYITKHGKEHTHVYHTHHCQGLKFSKYIMTEKAKLSKLGQTLNLEGTKYSLCSFCKRDRSKKSK